MLYIDGMGFFLYSYSWKSYDYIWSIIKFIILKNKLWRDGTSDLSSPPFFLPHTNKNYNYSGSVLISCFWGIFKKFNCINVYEKYLLDKIFKIFNLLYEWNFFELLYITIALYLKKKILKKKNHLFRIFIS